MEVDLALAGVDDFRQAGGDVQGKVGGCALDGLADAVTYSVVNIADG